MVTQQSDRNMVTHNMQANTYMSVLSYYNDLLYTLFSRNFFYGIGKT